jgi:hypothetical protein
MWVLEAETLDGMTLEEEQTDDRKVLVAAGREVYSWTQSS